MKGRPPHTWQLAPVTVGTPPSTQTCTAPVAVWSNTVSCTFHCPMTPVGTAEGTLLFPEGGKAVRR